MPSYDPDQDKPVEKQASQTLMKKVKELQERVKIMGAVSSASDDKAFMDEAWGDTEG